MCKLIVVASILALLLAPHLSGAFATPQSTISTNVPTSATTRHSTTSIGSVLQRVKDSVTSQERTRDELKLGIAGFYDRSSKLWEDVWGERKLPDNIQARCTTMLESMIYKGRNLYSVVASIHFKTCTMDITSQSIERTTNRHRLI